MILESEDDARTWLHDELHVPRGTMDRLEQLAGIVRAEAEHQNLVSRSTLPQLWTRHIADSAQLLLHAPVAPKLWVDVGSGAGFPGLVTALIAGAPTLLVEPRKLRAEFLRRAAADLGLDQVDVFAGPAEGVKGLHAGVVSARAVAALPVLLNLSTSFSTENTRFILPKGRSAQSELAEAKATWQGRFDLVPSVTDPHAGIIIAEGVRARRRERGP